MDEAREPEDRIEHIVREAEQGAQFEFNPAAWNAMEQKLDALDPVPFSIWKILFPLTGIAVLLMVLLWPIGAQDIQNRRMQVVEERVEDFLKENPEAAEKAAKPENNGPTESAATVQDSNNNDDDINASETSTEPLRQRTIDNTITNTQATNDQVARSEKETNVTGSTSSGLPAIPVSPENAQDEASEDASASRLGGSRLEEALRGVDMLSVRWNPDVILLPAFDGPFVEDSTNYVEGEPKPAFDKSRWAISAMVSLDMSATGLDGFTDPGTMFGLGVEYYIAPGWSIQTGAAISVKKYSALGSEYTIEGWGQGRIDNLETVLANCLVIDIPINIRKYFTTKNGNAWYASGGVSSYLMLREDYDYTYTQNPVGWGATDRARNENQHYLGILNLSFGYETSIGKNLGFGIEPFVKLPLTGIGQGGVEFLSFGTVLAIKLRK